MDEAVQRPLESSSGAARTLDGKLSDRGRVIRQQEKGTCNVNIEAIRKRVRDGNYLVKSHAIQHALKEV